MKNWIHTDGAPFICATPSISKVWRGTSGSSIGAAKSDYERLCEESDYLVALPCGASQVLLLGDEPAQAAFLMTPTGPAIARWMACESEALANSVLAQIPDILVHLQPAVPFQIEEPELWMLDASADTATSQSPASALQIAPGRFEVTTERYREGRAFDFLVHRFVRLEA